MLSQPVWDQMLESEKKKVQVLEESYAEKMRARSVSNWCCINDGIPCSRDCFLTSSICCTTECTV